MSVMFKIIHQWGSTSLFSVTLRVFFNKIEPVPRYNNIWSVDTVLDYLSLFWPLGEINLKELTLKLVLFIALTNGQRCQTLTFLDISEQCMQKNDKCFNFALTPGQVFDNVCLYKVCLYKYPVRELCFYETLNYYISTTEKLRNSTKLLVSFITPHRAVTSSTIGHWIKSILGQAGIDTEKFSGHSTRCASTNKDRLSVSTDAILVTAGWTKESTFRKFYNKPVAVLHYYWFCATIFVLLKCLRTFSSCCGCLLFCAHRIEISWEPGCT